MDTEIILLILQLSTCKYKISATFADNYDRHYAVAELIDCDKEYEYGNTLRTIKDYQMDHFMKPFGFPSFQQE